MFAEQLHRLIAFLYEAGASRSVYVPILIWGEAGIGKSETVKTVTDQLGVQMVDLRLGQMETGDLLGLPQFEKIDKRSRTTYAQPAWFPDEGSRGILFLDEINRSHIEVRQAVFQLILDRRMHTHVLPKEWIIVAAANPTTEEYDAQQMYDRAFLSRFMHVVYSPTSNEWLDYASKRDVHWSIRAMISEAPDTLGVKSAPIPDLSPTPRSWMMLNALVKSGLPTDLENEVASGILGPVVAAQWIKLQQSPDRPVKGTLVLQSYKEVRPTIKKYKERSDLLRSTLEELVSLTQDRQIDKQELENLADFFVDLPKDLAYGYLKQRFKHLQKRLGAIDKLYDFIVRINKESGIVT